MPELKTYEQTLAEVQKPRREKGLYIETHQAQRSNALLIRLPLSVYSGGAASLEAFRFVRSYAYHIGLETLMPPTKFKVTDEARITLTV